MTGERSGDRSPLPLPVAPAIPSVAMTSGQEASLAAGSGRGSLIGALLIVAVISLLALLLLVLPSLRRDPYTRATLSLKGSEANGERLFLINCAGCHGIDGQGSMLNSSHYTKNNVTAQTKYQPPIFVPGRTQFDG